MVGERCVSVLGCTGSLPFSVRKVQELLDLVQNVVEGACEKRYVPELIEKNGERGWDTGRGSFLLTKSWSQINSVCCVCVWAGGGGVGGLACRIARRSFGDGRPRM